MGKFAMILWLWFGCFSCLLAPAIGNTSQSQKDILLMLKQQANGCDDIFDGWTADANNNECDESDPWRGIQCSDEDIVGVGLTGCDLKGNLLEELGQLSKLRDLDLRDNLLTGKLPESFTLLEELEELQISENRLEGTIPVTWFQNLPKLEILRVRGNQLTGSFDFSWTWDHLRILDIADNMFNIPAADLSEISSVTLTRLFLSKSGIHGAFSESPLSAPNLKTFALSGNQITGGLPTWLAQFSALQGLRVQNTGLSGPLPAELEDVNIQTLLLDGSSIEANFSQLEPLLSSWSSLVELGIGDTQINLTWKQLLASVGHMKDLVSLSASGMSLTGPIGSFQALPASLMSLDLSHNLLSGVLHPDYSRLNNFISLDLSWNKIRGEVPSELVTPFLSGGIIRLDHNLLSGSLPVFVVHDDQIELDGIHLEHNLISGELDASLINLPLPANRIYLQYNKLNGSLPNEFFAGGTSVGLSNGRIDGNLCLCGELPTGGEEMFNTTGTRLGSSCSDGPLAETCQNQAVQRLHTSNPDVQGLLEFLGAVTGGHEDTRYLMAQSWVDSVHPCNPYMVECEPCYNSTQCEDRGTSTSIYCAWPMIGCRSGRVVSLEIPEALVLSRVPTELLQVEYLEQIQLIVGIGTTVSWKWLEELKYLRTVMLMLGIDGIYGTVAQLPEWADGNDILEELAYVNMNLLGSLPQSWLTLHKLSGLQLTNIIADGPWPSWRFPNLRTLWLEGLRIDLHESVDPLSWIQDSHKLSVVYLRSIPHARTTPTEVFDLFESANHTGIKILSVELGDGLTGVAPDIPETSVTANLSALILKNNVLYGTLPASWSRLTGALAIDVSGNRLDGPIPDDWSNMDAFFNISNNAGICGGAPAWFGEDLGDYRDLLLTGTNINSSCPGSAWVEHEGEIIALGSSIHLTLKLPGTTLSDKGEYRFLYTGPFSGTVALHDDFEATATEEEYSHTITPTHQDVLNFTLFEGDVLMDSAIVSVLKIEPDYIHDGNTFSEAKLAINHNISTHEMATIGGVWAYSLQKVLVKPKTLFGTRLHYNSDDYMSIYLYERDSTGEDSIISRGVWSDQSEAYVLPFTLSEVKDYFLRLTLQFTGGYSTSTSLEITTVAAPEPHLEYSNFTIEPLLTSYRVGDNLTIVLNLRDEADHYVVRTEGVTLKGTGSETGSITLPISYDPSNEFSELTCSIELKHIESLSLELYVQDTQYFEKMLHVDSILPEAIAVEESISLTTLSYVNESSRTIQTVGIEEIEEVVIGEDGELSLEIPIGTRYGSALPIDVGLDVELYLVPSDLYLQVKSEEQGTGRRRALLSSASSSEENQMDLFSTSGHSLTDSFAEVSFPPPLLVLPQNKAEGQEGNLGGFANGGTQYSAFGKSDIPLVENFEGYTSVQRYRGVWDANPAAYIVDILIMDEIDYVALLVVSYQRISSSIAKFSLRRYVPPAPVSGGEALQPSDKSSFFDITISFPTLDAASYPGGADSLLVDTEEALAFVSQVPLSNIVMEREEDEQVHHVRIYYSEASEVFSGFSMLDNMVELLREDPERVFTASGKDVLARHAVVLSVASSESSRKERLQSEDSQDERGQEMLSMLGMEINDVHDSSEESNEIELDERAKKDTEVIFIDDVHHDDGLNPMTMDDMLGILGVEATNLAPRIHLKGDEVVTLNQMEDFWDEGVVVEDDIDGFIMDVVTTVRICSTDGFRKLQKGVAQIRDISCLEEYFRNVNTSSPLPEDQLFVVTYDTEDSLGKRATTRYRGVHIRARCDPPEFWCQNEDQCSQFRVCMRSQEDIARSTAVPEATIPEDSNPPVIKLLGGGTAAVTSTGTFIMIDTVVVGESWKDPGVSAVDDVDGDISDRVMSYGAGKVETKIPTEEGKEFSYVIEYHVQDSMGNSANTVLRWIKVVCPPEESYCVLDGSPWCTWNAMCISRSTFEIEEIPSPPSISVLGPEVVQIIQGSMYSQCPEEAPPSLICDLGAVADDSTDGILTSRIEVCSTPNRQILFKSSIPLLMACDIDSSVPGEYSIMYSVSNSKGLSSSAVRNLTIEPFCPPGEHVCDNTECSNGGGICLDTVTSTETTKSILPPLVKLKIHSKLPETVAIPRGTMYQKCDSAVGQLPEDKLPCELGAAASEYDGQMNMTDITPSVLACLPIKCIQKDCSMNALKKHEFQRKGLTGCNIDPFAPVGTTFFIDFWVFGKGVPPLNSTVTRQVSIADPCPNPPSTHFCKGVDGDFFCSGLPCEKTENMLYLLQPSQDAESPPVIHLLPNSSNSLLLLEYGKPSDFYVGACASNSTEDAQNCGAIAVDPVDGDLTEFVSISDVSPCSKATFEAGLCSSCAVESLSLGVCFPGIYMYEYAVENSRGIKAAVVRTVVVFQKGRAHASYSLGTEFSSEDAALEYGTALLNSTNDVYQEVLQEIHEMLKSEGRNLPISNIALTSFNVTNHTVAAQEAYQILISFEISVYVPNISREVHSSGITVPAARKLLWRSENSHEAAEIKSTPSDLFHEQGGNNVIPRRERSAITTQQSKGLRSVVDSRPGALNSLGTSRKLLQDDQQYLSQELLDLSDILADFTNGSVAIENETGEEVDIARATIAELIGLILAYGSAQMSIRSTVISLASLTDTALGEQSQSVEDDSLLDLREGYLNWLNETQNLHTILYDKGETMSQLMNEQIVAFEELLGDGAGAMEEIKEQMAQSASLMKNIAEREAFLSFLNGNADEEKCSRDIYGGLSPSFVLENFQDTLDNKKRLRMLMGIPVDSGIINQDSSTLNNKVRRKLLQRRAGSSTASSGSQTGFAGFANEWSGYVVGAATVPDFVDPRDVVARERFASGRNLVMGGLFLHQTRKTAFNRCGRRFSHLSFNCQIRSVYENDYGVLLERFFAGQSNATHPFGTDPVFIKSSSVYSEELFEEEDSYYNMSDPCEASITGAPYAFHPISIPGFRDGFPVLAANELTRHRAANLIEYLKAGHFLDEQTENLLMEVAAYNPDLDVLVVGKTVFGWNKDGSIKGTCSFWGLNGMYSASASSNGVDMRLVAKYLIPLACLVGVYAIWVAARTGRRCGSTTEDIVVAALLASTVIVTAVLMFQYVESVNIRPVYSVYDAVNTAGARWLLPKKQVQALNDATLTDPRGNSNTTDIPSPGESGRWRLPSDHSEMIEYASAMVSIDTVAGVVNAGLLLQALTIIFVILRYLRLLSFQDHIGVITRTLENVIPQMAHFFLVLFAIVAMLAVLGNLGFGYRIRRLSNFGDAVSVMFSFMVAGDNDGLNEILRQHLEVPNGESLLAGVFYVIMSFTVVLVLLNFLLAIIVDVFSDEKAAAQDGTSVRQDLQDDVLPAIASCMREVIFRRRHDFGGEPSISKISSLFGAMCKDDRCDGTDHKKPNESADGGGVDLERLLRYSRHGLVETFLESSMMLGNKDEGLSKTHAKVAGGRRSESEVSMIGAFEHTDSPHLGGEKFMQEVSMQMEIFGAVKATINAVDKWQTRVKKWQARAIRELQDMMAATESAYRLHDRRTALVPSALPLPSQTRRLRPLPSKDSSGVDYSSLGMSEVPASSFFSSGQESLCPTDRLQIFENPIASREVDQTQPSMVRSPTLGRLPASLYKKIDLEPSPTSQTEEPTSNKDDNADAGQSSRTHVR